MARSMRVLVVEDEPLIALDIEAELTERGFEVVGPVGRVEAALALVEAEPLSVAVLDINLGTETSFEVARLLDDKRVPFVFLSGDAQTRPDEFNDRTVQLKPIDYARLDRTLRAMLSRSGEAEPR